MKLHRGIRTLGIALGLCGAACNGGGFAVNYHEHRPPPPPPRTIVVERPVHVVEHVCHAHCGHYYDGDHVVVIHDHHVHGPGCGHFHDGRRWVIVRRDHHHHHPPVIHKVKDPHHSHHRDHVEQVDVHKAKDPNQPKGPPPKKVIVK